MRVFKVCSRCGVRDDAVSVNEMCAKTDNDQSHEWTTPRGVDDRELKPGQFWDKAQAPNAVWIVLEPGETVFVRKDGTDQCANCSTSVGEHCGGADYRCRGRDRCPECGATHHYKRQCREHFELRPASHVAEQLAEQIAEVKAELEAARREFEEMKALREKLEAKYQAEVKRWRQLAIRRGLRLNALKAAVRKVLHEKGVGVKGELEAALAYATARGVAEVPYENRHDAMFAAIAAWIRMHEGHGPSSMDSADIHWPLYEKDYNMFHDALNGVMPRTYDPASNSHTR